MHIRLRIAILLLSLSAGSPYSYGAEAPTYTKTILSDVYTVDRTYRSMKGPSSSQDVQLGSQDGRELLWVTGYRATMVGPDGEQAQSQEFMCHSNLDIDIDRHTELFQWQKVATKRLFTLSQGQYEIVFPAGFGVPIFSDEMMSLATQVLNHNLEGQRFRVRHKVEIDYVKHAELTAPMKPLFMTAVTGLVFLEDQEEDQAGYFNIQEPDHEQHGPGCLVGTGASSHTYEDAFGRKFSGHWTVKPGRQVNRTLATTWMNLPFDTTIHYIAVHLHPFAESLELRDLTAGTTVFKSTVRSPFDRIGIDHVESFSSEEGIKVFRDHEYELISVYNNTTNEDQDSMAVMFLYLLDTELQEKNVATLLSARQK